MKSEKLQPRRINPKISDALHASEELSASQEVSRLEKTLLTTAVVVGIAGEGGLFYMTAMAYISSNFGSAALWSTVSILGLGLNGIGIKITSERFREAKKAKEVNELITEMLLNQDEKNARNRPPVLPSIPFSTVRLGEEVYNEIKIRDFIPLKTK